VIVVPALFCFAVPAHAVDPHRMISQYTRDHWEEKEGFPGGSVSAIVQSKDGYLWIGSEKGLVRFDGLNFRLFQQAVPELFTIGAVQALTVDARSNLWILLQGTKVLRFHDGKFELGRDQAEVGITAMGRRNDGAVLLWSLALGILTYNGQKFEILPSQASGQPTAAAVAAAQGDTDLFARLSWGTGTASHRVAEPGSAVTSMVETSDGRLWLGTADKGLFYVSAGRIFPVGNGAAAGKITCLLPMENGKLWVGTDKGMLEWNGAALGQERVPPALHHAPILAMIRDRDSNIWLGTAEGLVRVNGDGVSFDGGDHGTAPVTALFEDREGDLWVGRSDELERLRDSAFVTYSTGGAHAESTGPIYVDQDEMVWFAPFEGGLRWLRSGKSGSITNDRLSQDVVYSIAGGKNELWIGRQQDGLTHVLYGAGPIKTRTYTQADGLGQNSVYSVYEGRDGTVWAGTLSGGVTEFKDGHFTNYTTANGLVSNTVSAIAEGSDGTMWFGTTNGLSALSKNGWRNYSTKDGLPSESVNCLLPDSTGALWIGTMNGLAVLNAGQLHAPHRMPDSLREPIFGIAEDKNGWLWVATANHVLQVRRASLAEDALGDADVREYGLADGLRGTEGVKRFESVVEDSRGEIWFSTSRGLSVVNPARATINPVPALVHIDAVLADGNALSLREPLRITGGEPRITFRFTGLSLSDPERVRYRYKLDGVDRAWSEPTASREAGYVNLAPGSYRFRVVASNSDGLWNGSEAALGFQMEPTLWQTWWFRLALIFGVGVTVLVAYRVRMHRLTRMLNVRFEERLAERTRIAQDLHDNLLQGFFSAAMQLDVANDRLPPDSPAKPILERVMRLMNEVGQQGRAAIRSLRASDRGSGDLEQAFSRIREEVGGSDQVDFRVVVEGQPQPLHAGIWDDVYRIGREAVINAFRHSGASKIEVEVEYTGRDLAVLVRDNGRGIDAQVAQTGREGHWGLSGMRERAEKIGAKLEVMSRAGAGTEVELSVPGSVAFEGLPEDGLADWLNRLLRRKNGSKSAA